MATTAKTHYTTSGRMSFSEFIQTEVQDRGNYTHKEVLAWMRKYRISPESSVIWVSPDPAVALGYTLTAEERERGMTAKGDPEEVPASKGFIVPESDDGDNGFILVFNDGKRRKR